MISSPVTSEDMDYKCLALTGSFETSLGLSGCFSGLCGDFDGQGMSMGVLHWNLGQDSLQPLLKEMLQKHQAITEDIFQENFLVLKEALNATKPMLMTFVRAIQDPHVHLFHSPWKELFKTLGSTPEFQGIQRRHAAALFQSALGLSKGYGLWSERAVALMFDISAQNSGIDNTTHSRILEEFEKLPGTLPDEESEVRRMRIIANLRAEASNPRWIEDVRARKLCCANGYGNVHGVDYDLDAHFGIGLRRVQEIIKSGDSHYV